MKHREQHIDEGTLHAWLDGALGPEEAARVEAHVSACATCGAAAAEARGLVAAASRILTALDDVPGGVAPGGSGAGGPRSAARTAARAGRPLPFWMQRWARVAAVVLFMAAGSLAVIRQMGGVRYLSLSRVPATRPTVAPAATPPAATPPAATPPAATPRRDSAPPVAASKEERPASEAQKKVAPAPAMKTPPPAPAAALREASPAIVYQDSARAPAGPVTITGRVVSAKTGEPVSQAQVRLSNPAVVTATNDSGQYVISVPADQAKPQSAQLDVRRLGYERKVDSVAIAQAAARDTVRRDIALAPSTTTLSAVTLAGTRAQASAKAAAASAAAVGGAMQASAAPTAPGCYAAKDDTAFADTLYWQRQALAYTGAGRLDKAAECARMGLARFPNNETLMLLEAQDLAASGQVAQAKALLLQLLEQDPNNSNAALVLVTVYEGSGSPDSTLWAIRQAVAAGVPPSTAAAIALAQGNKYYRIGSASKIRDTLDVSIKFLAYSDSLMPDSKPKFLMSAAAFVAGDQAAQDAQKEKSCSLAKAAADYLTIARDNVPAGLQEFRDPATQIQQGLQQLSAFVQQEIKAYCK